MCSNVNSREMCDGLKTKSEREKKEGLRGQSKFSEEAQAESRKKILGARGRRERKTRERKNIREVARAWGGKRANAEEFKIKYCIKRKKVVSAFQKKI